MTDKLVTIAANQKRTFSLLPSSLGEAMEIAKLIADSDFAPKDYKSKPGNVLVAIQMGADIGLAPMQALQNIAVINGRPSIWGDAALALVQSSGLLERLSETIDGDGDSRTAMCVVKRLGLPDEVRRTFSVKDAKLAKLWGKTGRDGQTTPWVTYPDRMLAMRARGFALRDAFADCLMGLVLAEEAQDYPDAIDVTPTRAALPAETADPFARVPEALRDNLEKAFTLLNLNPGTRLVKVNEFLGAGQDPEEGATKLLEWCRDEFAKRQGKERAPGTHKVDNGKKPQAAKGAAVPSEASSSAPTNPPPAATSGPVGASGADTSPPQGAPKTVPVSEMF